MYTIPKGLLHEPKKKEKIEFTKTLKTDNLFAHAMNINGQGSNCWATHGNHTKSGKPIIACDPHLGKMQNSIWYNTRLRWNQTDARTGKEERTYLLGSTIVGVPVFSHGRTPVIAWGQTAVNPDIVDLFVETIKDGTHYLVGDGTWEPIMQKHETIKVKGKPDVDLVMHYTRNGVLMPPDLIEGSAKDMMPWISSDVLWSDEVDGVNKIYAMANIYDPIISDRFEETVDDFNLGFFMTLCTNTTLRVEDAPALVYHSLKLPTNIIFGVVETGEIGYMTTGKFPLRNHNIAQGVYPKLGHLDQNRWTGLVPFEQYPVLVNPDKGFIVTANNFITSDKVEYAIGHTMNFQHRAVRITELILEYIESGKKMTVYDH